MKYVYKVKDIPAVYMLICKENKKIYIGSSLKVRTRLNNHFKNMAAGRHENKYIQQDYNNGFTFDYKIIKFYPGIDKMTLNLIEFSFIHRYCKNNELYNIDGFKSQLPDDPYLSFCYHYANLVEPYFIKLEYIPDNETSEND